MRHILLQPGERFGRLIVLSLHGRRGRYTEWLCACDCGKQKVTDTFALRYGRTKSCGCFLSETNRSNKTKHGHATKNARTPEYQAWGNMRDRCYQKSHISFPRYGGRGIRVCDRWRLGENGKTGFECFLEDMGPRPSPEHSIDRYPDNDGHYEPGNVRWATPMDQARNTSGVRYVEWDGKRMALSQLCEELGLKYSRVLARITKYGYSLERAITEPNRRAA